MLAPFTHSYGHWDHAQNHGARGHQHGPEPCVARNDNGGPDIIARLHPLIGESHDQNAVCSRKPQTHQSPHQGRDAEVGAREKQRPDNSAQGEWQGHNNDQRIDPALKVDDQNEIYKEDRKGHSGEEPGVALEHGLHLPGEGDLDAGLVLLASQHLFNICRNRAEIASLDVGIDVGYRHDIELRNSNRDIFARELRNIHEQLAVFPCSLGDRHGPEILR